MKSWASPGALVAAVSLACIGFAIWDTAFVVRNWPRDFLAGNDFFAQWAFARMARQGDAVLLYDADALMRFQRALEPLLWQNFPFPYPPSYLFVVWPLGWLPFGLAQIAWDAAGLALFACAVLGDGVRPAPWALVMLAPVTVICLAYGQNGLLVSALIVAGLRWVPDRAVLGGAVLGLVSIKPQFLVVVVFALVAARAWRALAAAGLVAAALAGLSAWAFGAAAWTAWAEVALHHAAWLQGQVSDYRKPTVMATLMLLGAGPLLAAAGQACVALLVLAVLAVCCARGMGPLAQAAVQTATFLVVPFAFLYDLPMVLNAVLLTVAAHRRSGQRWSLVAAAILALGVLFPAVTTMTTRFFYLNPLALALLFGLIAARCLQIQTPRLHEPGRLGADST